MRAETLNPYHIAQRQIKEAIDALGVEPAAYEILKQPLRFLEVSIPVRRDDGSLQVFTGYRSQHNDALGPAKGGIRFHPGVHPDEVKALSMWMTFKCSLLGLPYGGGKGAVACDPKEMSPGELERLSRGFVRAVAALVGPEKDIPAPDVYTNPQVMAWMADEYSQLRGHNSFGLVTGKPLVLGGSLGREEATGRGCVIVALEAARRLGFSPRGIRAVVQGFGNVGSVAARLLREAGAKVIAVNDSRGGAYRPEGLDPVAVKEHKLRTGSVQGAPGTEDISNEDLLTLDCDLLIPAALENQITTQNAERIRAKIVAEAANGPTTPEADRILHERGILVIPDILASAGGVTVSYFEWVQNLQNFYWTEEEVNGRLEQMMRKSFELVEEMRQERRVPLRQAAFLVAVKRVVDAMRVRGWLN